MAQAGCSSVFIIYVVMVVINDYIPFFQSFACCIRAWGRRHAAIDFSVSFVFALVIILKRGDCEVSSGLKHGVWGKLGSSLCVGVFTKAASPAVIFLKGCEEPRL